MIGACKECVNACSAMCICVLVRLYRLPKGEEDMQLLICLLAACRDGEMLVVTKK